MFNAKCDKCGNSCELPFRPSGDKPVFCDTCFKDKRRNSDRPLFKAVCAACGQRCEVPFNPSGDKPIYCNKCFGGIKRSDPGNSGGVKPNLETLNAKLDQILKTLGVKPVNVQSFSQPQRQGGRSSYQGRNSNNSRDRQGGRSSYQGRNSNNSRGGQGGRPSYQGQNYGQKAKPYSPPQTEVKATPVKPAAKKVAKPAKRVPATRGKKPTEKKAAPKKKATPKKKPTTKKKATAKKKPTAKKAAPKKKAAAKKKK